MNSTAYKTTIDDIILVADVSFFLFQRGCVRDAIKIRIINRFI